LKDANFGKVYNPIGLMALDVLIRIFDTSNTQNNEQGKGDEARRDGSELWEELENGDEGEKSVRRSRVVSEADAGERSVLHIGCPAKLL
jgi:hypothetical protein